MISEKRRASNQSKKLAKMAEAILVMAEEWEEVDHYLMSNIRDTAHDVIEASKTLRTFVDEE